ncbi:TIR domain-containing protein [Halorubrum sp. AJ67]|uniref:TIR domain-containing protein n=1 Tax=Halorubrum sp. AJ67 TaxID=1173487 RepID=UPI0009ABB6EE|nr:TIR domain-containing protein [Halorubrum sp. AJ67]
MARRVFFSFHYGRDVWRANQVRHSWVTSKDREAAGFFDAAEQETIKQATDEKIRHWINEQLQGTSVTVVLIGNETAERDWIHYEIKKSIERGNGIVGVKIHSLNDKESNTDFSGTNPLKKFVVEEGDKVRTLSTIFPTYDWKRDNGRENIGKWAEEAAQTAESLSRDQQNSVRRRETISEGLNPDAGTVIFVLIIIAILIDKYTDINLRETIDLSQLQQQNDQSDPFSKHEF